MALSRSTLVSVQWLKQKISSKINNFRLLDASWHLPNTGRDAKVEFAQNHIPGALFFDIDNCAVEDTDLPHMIPSAQVFENYVGGLGINNETHVVVYDNNPTFPLFSAQRVWWMLRLFGHENTSLLEGGLPKWLAEGGEVTQEVTPIQKQTFTAKFNPALIKYYGDIERNISASAFTLVDARPQGRFQGIAPEPRDDTKPGCIPGSKNIPFLALMNAEDRTVKRPEELKAIFQEAGIDIEKHFVVSCGSGISACILALAAHLCGNDDVAVYDGAWTEWYLRAPAELKLNVPKD
ncbi:sulfurtransferase [Plakobranchus ocellatus]|uniref:Sulfurtransferase n=1 Tax=Plakobranchus ocellatus TaxID=259542 RepID=A0AAV3ZRG6_9GAST|nr:sulfurtransferase [Plakobranchus ocellatus]